MGVFNSIRITTTVREERISSMANYLNNLEGVTAESGTATISGVECTGVLFSLDGTNISGFYGYNNQHLQMTGVYVKNGDTELLSAYGGIDWQGATDIALYSYVDEECILITLSDLHNDRIDLEVVLVNTADSKKLVGYGYTTATNGLIDIGALSGTTPVIKFEDIDDPSRAQCSYTNMFPYTATAGTIDFTNEAFFINNGYKKFTTSILKECSTVPICSTQSLPVSNCVALGAHCLAPLDPE